MVPTMVANRYRVLRELGRGGMGVVYLVEHVHTGDNLALKLMLGNAALQPEAVERFKREARASARIKSEHVVKVVDADVAPELDGAPFLVMELLNGTGLDQELEQRGRFTPEQTLHYLSQAARALDKSHQMGIVHRDLKPENLFLHRREDGTTILKILDFGISKRVTSDANDIAGAGMTKTGAVMGTPLYMSPEQARGRISEIGPATDVWAMGLIAMLLLSGEIYWRANTVGELMSQIIAEPLYPPSERWTSFGPGVDEWFARSCARDPKARFATVGEQMDALGEVLAGRAMGGGALAPRLSAPRVTNPSTVSGPMVAEARTTTGAVIRDGDGSNRGARTGAVIVGLLVAAAAVGGILVAMKPQKPPREPEPQAMNPPPATGSTDDKGVRAGNPPPFVSAVVPAVASSAPSGLALSTPNPPPSAVGQPPVGGHGGVPKPPVRPPSTAYNPSAL